MTDTQRAYIAAVKALNEATHAAIKSARDHSELPMVNRQMLLKIFWMTNEMVDAGLDTANGDTK